MSSFNGLNIVRTGLFAAQRALEVVGQNVANANTPGYSRQEVSYMAAQPAHVINAPGRGISEVNVLRYRDEFLDRQFRSRAGLQGYHDTRSNGLAQAEEMLGTLTDGGLRTSLEQFFNSWQHLSMYPLDSGARSQVIATAEGFITQARMAFDGLVELRAGLEGQLETKVAEVNKAAGELAELNKAIVLAGGNQQEANQLMDRRDVLIDSLAKLSGATSIRHTDGTVTVHIGSLPLVDRNSAYTIDSSVALEADMDADPTITSIQQFTAALTWNGTGTPVTFPTGELGALAELRDQVLPEHMKSLDNLVRQMAAEVNRIHRDDGTGAPDPAIPEIFTIQPGWMAIEVNPALQPGDIVAAGTVPPAPGTPAPGDGERARAIANLRDAQIVTGGPVGTRMVKPAEFLQAIVSQVGIQVQEAGRLSDAAALQVAQVEKQRQGVSGVSLDEEMTKMIQYQQAYNAAARVMTTMDEMLDIMVNRVGLVGR